MGEIIFKFPENIKKEILIDSVNKIEGLVKNLESKRTKRAIDKLLKYKGIAKSKTISQEELHTQEI